MQMEPGRHNQQGEPSYAGNSGIDANRAAQHTGSTASEEDGELLYRFDREDRIWEVINILMTFLGALLILIGLIATFINPVVGIAAIISGFITDCIPVLGLQQREASWKRLNTLRQQRHLERLIEKSSGELQKRALVLQSHFGCQMASETH